jgi:transporter family protein
MGWLGWALCSAVFAAATAILAKIGVKDVDSNLATAIRTTVILVFAWTWAIARGAHGGIQHIERRSWVFLALSGLATGASWICYFHALQIGEAGKVAPIDKLSVVFVVIFAALFLGESVTFAKVAGAVLIAAGAIVLARA